ncbi:MAG: NAD(P)/FAD-dependent oxidoreductase [Patescibacteria group bacterium]
MKENPNTFDVIVVGGGPSGMMAAGFAAKRGLKVLLLEKNARLGDKLMATGGGRCNITNAEEDRETLLRNYGEAKDFLYSAFAQFGVKETIHFFEDHDLPLKIEDKKRVFPKSGRATDVFQVLEKFMNKGGVVVKSDQRVLKILTNENKIIGVLVGKEKFYADSLILATGGLSRPELGASGEGFRWLESLGHKVKKPSPDIVPLAVSENWAKELSGISLPLMKITFFVNGLKKFSKKGSLLFTHFGISGPLILNSAKLVKPLLKEGAVTAQIDTYPDKNIGELEKEIIKTFDENKNKTLKNILTEIVPNGLAKILKTLFSNFDIEKKVHSVTKIERREIVELLKALPVTVTGLMGFDRAVVSDGGLELTEIDMKTMRSKLHPNLYVTGDLLNITRPSGGFSLQLCWTTGAIAGKNVGNSN